MNENLAKKIREKYKSDAAFGLSIGWTPQKVYKLIRGEYIPKISEATVISKSLDTTIDELANFFVQ